MDTESEMNFSIWKSNQFLLFFFFFVVVVVVVG